MMTIFGTNFSDIFDGTVHLGAIHFDGKVGEDAVTYEAAAAAIGADIIRPGFRFGAANEHSFTDIETFIGSYFDDRLGGARADETFFGGDGNDAIDGRGGNNTLYGGNGDDSIIVDGGDDILFGGAGADVIQARSGNDVINGGAGADTLYGGDGIDLVDFSDSATRVIADLDKQDRNDFDAEGDVFVDVENLRGTDFDDYLGGSDTGASELFGAAGDDVLDGRRGDNTLFGGDGDDTLIADGGDDHMFGGDGNDRLESRAGDDVLNGGKGDDTLQGGAGSDLFSFTLTDDQDVITDFQLDEDVLQFEGVTLGTGAGQTDPDDFLNDYASVDGRDVVFDFGDGNSVRVQNVFESEGTSNSTQVLIGALGDGGTGAENYIFGTEEGEYIRDSGDSDIIFAGAGDDDIELSWGFDVVTTGPGADNVYLDNAQDPSFDGQKTITDFEIGVDDFGTSPHVSTGDHYIDGNDFIVELAPNFSPFLADYIPLVRFEDIVTDDLGDDPDIYFALI